MGMIKLLLLIPFIYVGCSSESKEYQTFVSKYKSDTRTYCDGNFKMRETFMSPQAHAPQEFLINSNDCK